MVGMGLVDSRAKCPNVRSLTRSVPKICLQFLSELIRCNGSKNIHVK